MKQVNISCSIGTKLVFSMDFYILRGPLSQYLLPQCYGRYSIINFIKVFFPEICEINRMSFILSTF